MGHAAAWGMGWTNNPHRNKMRWIDCLVERVRWARPVAHTRVIRIMFKFLLQNPSGRTCRISGMRIEKY